MAERYYSGKTVTDILQQEIDNADLLLRILSRLKYAEVEVLEELPSDFYEGDTISRQQAMELVLLALTDNWDSEYTMRRMRELPPVQPDTVDISKVTMAMAKQADLVAVIRCRDCKYCDPMTKQGYSFDWCEKWDSEIGSEESFCSRAEIREDEQH